MSNGKIMENVPCQTLATEQQTLEGSLVNRLRDPLMKSSLRKNLGKDGLSAVFCQKTIPTLHLSCDYHSVQTTRLHTASQQWHPNTR